MKLSEVARQFLHIGQRRLAMTTHRERPGTSASKTNANANISAAREAQVKVLATREDPAPHLAERGTYEEIDDRLAADLARWDGRTIRDLETERFTHFEHQEHHARLHESVPLEYRGEVWEPADAHAAYRQRGIEILALDAEGMALVKDVYVYTDVGFDKSTYRTMNAAEAVARVDAYRTGLQHAAEATIEILEPEALEGPTELDVADSEFSHIPEPGNTYIGPILRVEDDCAFQQVEGFGVVIHDLRHFVDRTQISSGELCVELCYPHGRVGLVRDGKRAEAHLDTLEVSRDRAHPGDLER